MLCGMMGKKNKAGTPVYINVYDLMPINRYAYWFGLGFYHSGVQDVGFGQFMGSSTHLVVVTVQNQGSLNWNQNISKVYK